MKTKNAQYGLFYKSQGRWTGPYGNAVLNKQQILEMVPQAKAQLKSKIAVRKVRFAK